MPVTISGTAGIGTPSINATGNITGNVTGNITGNVAGNLTGNVSAQTITTASLTATNALALTNRPAFYAFWNERRSFGTNVQVFPGETAGTTPDVIYLNEGNHYVPSTGFITPRAGIYQFTMYITRTNNNVGSSPAFYILKNGGGVASGLCYTVDYSGSSITALIPCVPGDVVRPTVQGVNNGNANWYWLGFMGYLL